MRIGPVAWGSGSVAEWWDDAWAAADHAADPARLRALARWLRPNGSVYLADPVRSRRRLAALERAVRRVGDPALGRVVSWWRPASRIGVDLALGDAPAATGFDAQPPAAILREGWQPRGSAVALVHAAGGLVTRVEVASRGVRWLGPTWTSLEPRSLEMGGSPRAAHLGWTATSLGADAVEWSFGSGPTEMVRSVVLLRQPGLALLLQTESPPLDPVSEARWDLPDGITASHDPASRALILRAGPGRPTARLVALGLPPSDYATDRGSLTVEGGAVVLRQAGGGPHRCLALLVAWDSRPPLTWRTLTVAERSAAVAPGTAFAARVGFGAGRDGLLLYRSLGPPALRSVLGQQTKARWLVAAWEPKGTIRPWIRANKPMRSPDASDASGAP